MRLDLDDGAVVAFGGGVVPLGQRGVAQVEHEHRVLGFALEPVRRHALGFRGLAAGTQRHVQPHRVVGGLAQAGGRAIGGGRRVPVPAAGLDVAFQRKAQGILGLGLLHFAHEAERIRHALFHHRQHHQAALGERQVGPDLQRLAQRALRTGGILVGQQRVGQAHLMDGVGGLQRDQPVEGGHGLLRVAGGELAAPQHVGDLQIVGQSRGGLLRRGQRGLGIGRHELGDERDVRRGLACIGLHGVAQQLDDLVRRRTRARAEFGQAQRGLVVGGLGLQQRLEALARGIGLAGGQFDGRHAGHRREVGRVLGQCGLEGGGGACRVALEQQHAAAQVGGHGAVRGLALQAVDGLERAGQVALAQACADQRQVGAWALVLGGDGFELGNGVAGIAAGDLGQRGSGADPGVVGRGLRGLGEGGLGLLVLAQLQPGLADQGQAVAVDDLAVGERLQHLDGLGRLARAQIGLGQHLARHQQARCALQRLGQRGFSLDVALAAEVGDAGQLQHLGVVWHGLEQARGDLARGLVVLGREGVLGLQVERVRVVGQHLLELIELRAGLFGLLLFGEDADGRRVG